CCPARVPAASSSSPRPSQQAARDEARQAPVLARALRPCRRERLPEHRHLAPDPADVRSVDTSPVEPSEPYPPDRPARPEQGRDPLLLLPGGVWAMGERVTALAGFVLMLSSFLGRYAGSGEGPAIAGREGR